MFSKQPDVVLPDLSPDLRDELDWKAGALRTFDFPLNITTLAIEPVAGLLATGTASGDIHVFGRPGVQSKFTLPQSVEVRFLQFSTSTFNIVCLDGNNHLHVYSLLEFGRPKLIASSRFDLINSMTLSPSHTHVFLATQSGEIKTYDLTCLRKSPYTTPNLWKLYEEKLTVNGMPSLAPQVPVNAVEAVIHPRNLDLMFVAYAGGVILTDLTERSTIRVYELTLSPGAPGGSGYGMDDILTHRKIMVTCLAVHPSGHMLAVGYADGSIAFWALEDDNKPLLVRTLDTVDVNMIHADILETHLSSSAQSKAPLSVPEPIFKLSWSSFVNSSDPRGGETVLAVLGGLDAAKPPGLTVFLLPAFNPPEPPSDTVAPPDTLHPFFRDAICQSLTPKKSFFYETQGIVQDYLLLPRSNPHFGGNFDPYGILIITELKDMQTVEAYQYPPPGFIQTIVVPPKVEEDREQEEPSSGMLSPAPPTPLPKSPRHLHSTPLPLRLPTTLLAGHSGILGGQLLKLHNDIYQDFISQKSVNDDHINLKGGQAYPDPTKANELKLSKYQPHRVLMSYNRDLSVRFFDLSTQLLIPAAASNLVEHEWPGPIPALTVHLDEIFDDPALAQFFGNSLTSLSIQSVHLAPEALEIAILLKNGEVVVYRQASNRPGASSSSQSTSPHIIMLDHLHPNPGSRLIPYFIFAPDKGPAEACALADTGFLAVSYNNGSLFAIDMRGPNVILERGMYKKHKHNSTHLASPLGHGSGLDIVRSLTWTVVPLDKDPSISVRLIAGHQSGHAEVYTLIHSVNPSSWTIAGEPVASKVMPEPIAGGTFVLDSKTGTQCKADRARLAASLKGLPPSGSSAPGSQCILVAVGAKGARSSVNITGEKVGKVEWGTKIGSVQGAFIVEHTDSRTLVIQTDRHDAVIYSLPHLEHIHTVQLPFISSLPLAIDESGDFIAWKLSPLIRSAGVMQSATYGTFFDVRRTYTLPDIEFAAARGVIPPQPQPVPLGPTSVLGSWFTFNQTKAGDQIDELLGGPNRPIPVKTNSASASREGMTETVAGAGAGIVAGAAAAQASIYNRLASAMNERGQLLGDLNERFNSLEEGSKNMVAQAKRLAAQQTAKSWFGL